MDTTIDDYFIQIGAIPMLDVTQEKELFQKVSEGNKIAKEKIIKSNLRLVVDIAKKYTKRGLPMMDLIQEGNMGLIHAVDKFDLKFNCRFSTYATGWVKCFILRGLSENHLIRFPRRVVEEIKWYRKTWDSLTSFSHREPTEQELADKMGLTIKKVKRIKGAMLSENLISLDKPVGIEENGTLGGVLTNENDNSQEEYTNKSVISRNINETLFLLSLKERIAIIHHYGLFDTTPKSHEELSKVLCMTREGARKVVLRAFKKLRAEKRLKKLKGLLE